MTQHTSIKSMPHDKRSGWWTTYLKHRHGVLFYSLLLTLVGDPIIKALGGTSDVLLLFVVLNLLAAALQLDTKKGRRTLLAIVMAVVFLKIGALQAGHAGLSTASHILWTLIALFAVFGALRFVLRSSAITIEHLYAALSAYLLVGVFLGMLYWSLEEAWPGSLVVSGGAASQPFKLSQGIYFSFITLATVGYGDMVPGNDMVRGLAVVEAIAGQFYLAVMIARLMSLYMREAR
ncbi:MAG: potassium channel family protein [Nitrospiraceae bacterium]